MAGFSPADLRAESAVLLLDLELGGHTFRVGEQAASITAADGTSLVYAAALDTGGAADSFTLFTDSSVPLSVDCTVFLDGLAGGQTIVDLIKMGHDLQAGEASVYAALPDADERRLLVRGRLVDVSYGGADEPITFSVEADTADIAGRTHPETAKISTDTLGDSAAGGAGNWRWDAEAEYEWYPTVIGKPGSGDGSAFGSPCFGLNDTGAAQNGFLLAGHAVKATSVYVETFDGNAQSGTQSVLGTYSDLLGRRLSIADTDSLSSPRWAEGTEIWADWGASLGGMKKPGGDLMRGAGDVLMWLAHRSSMAWDFPALAAIAPSLNAYLIDTYIAPEPGERLSPWEWATDHVLPLLPVSVVSGPRGLRLALWRPDATATEAVAHLDTSRNASRASSVDPSDARDVFNEFRLDYGVDARRNRPTLSAIVSGHAATVDSIATARRLPALTESETRYGYRPRSAQRSEAVWDDATALRVLTWQARRYGLPTLSVEYAAEPGLGYLQPADVVTVTDAGLGWTDRVALVETPALEGAAVRLALRLY